MWVINTLRPNLHVMFWLILNKCICVLMTGREQTTLARSGSFNVHRHTQMYTHNMDAQTYTHTHTETCRAYSELSRSWCEDEGPENASARCSHPHWLSQTKTKAENQQHRRGTHFEQMHSWHCYIQMHLHRTPVMHTFSHTLVKTHTVCCMEILPVPELWLFVCNRTP